MVLFPTPLDVSLLQCEFSIALVYHTCRSSSRQMVLEGIAGSVLRQIDHEKQYIAHNKLHLQTLNSKYIML
jgi:hypothetical protein